MCQVHSLVWDQIISHLTSQDVSPEKLDGVQFFSKAERLETAQGERWFHACAWYQVRKDLEYGRMLTRITETLDAWNDLPAQVVDDYLKGFQPERS